MSGGETFGWVVVVVGGLLGVRSIYLSFTAWLDDYLAQSFGDRRHKDADADWNSSAWGEVVYLPTVRAPADFGEVKAPTELAVGGGSGAGAFSTQGNQTQFKQLQTNASTSLNIPANRAGRSV